MGGGRQSPKVNVHQRRPVATSDRGDLESLGVDPTRILDT